MNLNERFHEESIKNEINAILNELSFSRSSSSLTGEPYTSLNKKIFKEIYSTDNFKNLLDNESPSFNDDKDALVQLYKKEICNQEKLHHFFDEKSI